MVVLDDVLEKWYFQKPMQTSWILSQFPSFLLPVLPLPSNTSMLLSSYPTPQLPTIHYSSTCLSSSYLFASTFWVPLISPVIWPSLCIRLHKIPPSFDCMCFSPSVRMSHSKQSAPFNFLFSICDLLISLCTLRTVQSLSLQCEALYLYSVLTLTRYLSFQVAGKPTSLVSQKGSTKGNLFSPINGGDGDQV